MNDISPRDERELLLLLKQGNEQVFEKIYNLYSPRIFGNIYKMVKSKPAAEEILQDVFIKIWSNRASIDLDKSFRSYLFRIAENKVYDFFRKAVRDKKIQVELFATATEEYEHIEEMIYTKENALLLQKAIDSLSPQRQQIFRLIKLDNKSYNEVSSQLGISVSTISDHIVKANKAIREFIFTHNGMTIIIFCLLLSINK
ncbi:MAG: RNA polymerase sigma-70 factor [Bacteroidetes bacterium]|nr:MAG: RNA polymerase sigma-70 factor [Bacteroidota bacterium]